MKRVLMMTMAIVLGCASMKAQKTDDIATVIGNVISNVVVKQDVTLTDGRTVTVFYKKTADGVEVYSEAEPKDYKVEDLYKVKTSTFEVVSSGTKGKKLRTIPMAEAKKIAGAILGKL